jgi:allantoate deiminase
MLFVPSKRGISHSPDEFTEIEFLEKGILTLAEALYRLAYFD